MLREGSGHAEAASSLQSCEQPVYLQGFGFLDCENDDTEPLEMADRFHTEGWPPLIGSDYSQCSVEPCLSPSCRPQWGEEVEGGFILGK